MLNNIVALVNIEQCGQQLLSSTLNRLLIFFVMNQVFHNARILYVLAQSHAVAGGGSKIVVYIIQSLIWLIVAYFYPIPLLFTGNMVQIE